MKSVIAALSLTCVVACRAASGTADAWLAEPPPEIATPKSEKIPVEFFEIVASMKGNAEAELQKKTFVPISEAYAGTLVGRCYSCPKGKRPYLVRAVFGFAGTGRFYVVRVGRVLWVEHGSLGRGFTSARSAVIVNLDFEPSAAYATVDIAE